MQPIGSSKFWVIGWLATIAIAWGPAWILVIGQESKPAANAKPAEKSPAEAVAIYSDAANFQNNGAYDLAVEEWTKFLRDHAKDPLAPKAQYYLAVCHVQLKQFAKAVALLETLLKGTPEFELAEDVYLNLGWSQYSLASASDPKSYAAAQATFERLSQKFPNGKHADQAAYFLGECHYHQGQKKAAVASYESVLTKFEKSAFRCDAAYALGVAYEELEQFADAGKTYDLYLAECTSSPLVSEVRMRKAETVLQSGKFPEAERLFAEVAALPDFAFADHALMRQADCLVRAEKLAEAAAVYGKVTTTFATSTHRNAALTAAGRCLYRAEKYTEAAVWFQKMVDLGLPESAEAAHWLARIHLKGKHPQEALLICDQVLPLIKDSPWQVHLLLDRGDALYELPERKSDAIAVFAKLATDFPQHELAPQALYNAAFGLLENKQYEQALQQATAFAARYEKDRLLPDMKFIAAESQLLQNKHAEAEVGYQNLIRDFAHHADAEKWQIRSALASLLQKKYAAVLSALGTKVAELKTPDHLAEAQFLIGSSYLGLDQNSEAVQAFSASVAAQPKWRQADEAWLGMARAQRKLGKIDEARATIQKLIQEIPQSGFLDQAHYRLGEYAYAKDDYAAALSAYDQVLKQWPNSSFAPFALYGKGWGQLKLKQFPAAVESLTAMLTQFPEHTLANDARFARAMSRRQANDFGGAIEDLTAYLKSNPDQDHLADAVFERGLAESGAKQLEAACASFKQVLTAHPKYAAADKVRYELAWALKTQDKADEATAEFEKLARAHPDSLFAAESLFHLAESQYDKKQYEEALKTYTLAQPKSKSQELSEKTAYKLGWSHFQLRQFEPALSQFTAQLAASPMGTLATDGQFMQTECLFRLQKYGEAYEGFLAARKLPMIPAKLDVLVLLHGGQSAGQLKKWPESLVLLAEIPKKYADSPYLAEAHYEMGWAHQNLKQPAEALKDYELAATKSREAVGARARFMIGEVLFEKKEFEEAIKQFQRVMYTFGAENATAEVKVWQAQSGFEAARCWEVQIQSAADNKRKMQCVAEATRHYNYVVEKHSQSKLAADARKRLDALSKL